MIKKFKLLVLSLAISSFVATAAMALPFASNTQFDPTATGNFAGPTAVTGITSWDWQDTGSLVINNNLISTTVGGQTTLGGTLAGFDFNTVGNSLIFNFEAQARLNGLTGGSPSPAPGLSTNGSSSGGTYEVTTTMQGQETGTVTQPGVLSFSGVSGTFEFFLDDTPDSNVQTGAGFNDGTSPLSPFLWGALSYAGGSFDSNIVTIGGTYVSGGTGNTTFISSISGYDHNVIQPDPTGPNLVLVGNSFITTVNFALPLVIGTTEYLGEGGASPLVIGAAPYTVQQGDLIMNADSKSTFTAIPEPGTIVLLGIGLLGVAGVLRKRMA